MRRATGSPRVQLSASDLARHLGCQHLTTLDLEAAFGRLKPPSFEDPALEVLQQRGFEHEAAYLQHLEAKGRRPARMPKADASATVEAMRAGVDVIVQAYFESDGWIGYADVLLRVDQPTELGGFGYEVVDTKLARETKAGTLLQLCVYSDLLGELQGSWPERAHVVTPGVGFEPESYRLEDFAAYYRFVKRRLLASAREGTPPTRSEPVAQCDVCRWWKHCDNEWRARDDLSLVAGISRLQRRQLEEWNVNTLTALSQLPEPLPRPSRGSRASLLRVREQARVQLESRGVEPPRFELLSLEEGRGLLALPEPSPADVFFDIEGDPFVDPGGLEYLLGWAAWEGDSLVYHALWATTREEERSAFEQLVDELTRRAREAPGFHVYHYAPYEPSAVKRLMGRYGTREAEVDQLLRERRFVDLYAIARQSLRAGVERYSIKNLEPLYGFVREVDVESARKSLRGLERMLELSRGQDLPAQLCATVEGYNRDDCVSTAKLRDWLESLRSAQAALGAALARPAPLEAAAPVALSEKATRVEALRARLCEGVSADRQLRDDAAQARWVLGHLLDWHRREAKVEWWERFRLSALSDEELLDEDQGLAGLRWVETLKPTSKRARARIDRYHYDPQDTTIDVEDEVFPQGAREPFGTVVAIDPGTRTIDIRKKRALSELHPTALYAHCIVPEGDQAAALFQLGEVVAEQGIDDPQPPLRAARDLLLARPPRLAPGSSGPLVRPGEATLEAAKRLVLVLDGGVLALQGPPGAGKTFTAAEMIVALVQQGRRVGITAMSHKVIRNLLDAVVAAADRHDVSVRCLHKVSERTTEPDELDYDPIQETEDAKQMRAGLTSRFHVGAGTTWLWSREDLVEAVDTLFVDEAGQMSLANVLAAARAAKNVVLLGDPRQLEQPLRGGHPEGTEVSALEHLIGEAQTIAADRGVFLEQTWRLHPSICSFTSSLFYDGRLSPRSGLERQSILGSSPFAGSGLIYVPVKHEGNQTTSAEEVAQVMNIRRHLLGSGLLYRDSDGRERRLIADDILVVAPYNAHVGALAEALGDANRVGTVDKFQGQERPVVIYTMATSSAEGAPRGLEFILSLNRLNVATSRARALCIIIASPTLFQAECRTPRQMQLVNAHCRYVELARVVDERAMAGLAEAGQ